MSFIKGKHKKSLIEHLMQVLEHANEHRPWNYADEQGWQKHLYLPLTAQKDWTIYGTPVIQWITNRSIWIGEDNWKAYSSENKCIDPCVIFVNGKVRAYYCSMMRDEQTYVYAFRGVIAESSDFKNFTGKGFSVNVGGVGAWDEDYIRRTKVIIDTFESDPNKRYKMLYIGGTSGAGNSLGYAYSADGISWTKYASNPITHPYGSNPQNEFGIFRFGKLYYMVYRDSEGDLTFATSKDFINWTAQTKIGIRTVDGWDSGALGFSDLHFGMGVFYLFCEGKDSYNQWRLGLFHGTSPFNALTKYVENPILEETGPTRNLLSPTLIEYEEFFKLYFESRNVAGSESVIKLATLTGE